MTPDQLQYLQERVDETRVPAIHVSNGICIAAATISVVLRFFARRLSRSGFGKDDYCLFLAYVSLSTHRPKRRLVEGVYAYTNDCLMGRSYT